MVNPNGNVKKLSAGKTNLQVHFDIYKETLHQIGKQSRQSFFSDIITKNKNNACVLYSVYNRSMFSTTYLPIIAFSSVCVKCL